MKLALIIFAAALPASAQMCGGSIVGQWPFHGALPWNSPYTTFIPQYGFSSSTGVDAYCNNLCRQRLGHLVCPHVQAGLYMQPLCPQGGNVSQHAVAYSTPGDFVLYADGSIYGTQNLTQPEHATEICGFCNNTLTPVNNSFNYDVDYVSEGFISCN